MKGSYEVKKVPLWPVVKVTFVIFLVIGILIAILYSVLISGIGFLASSFGDAPFGDDFLAIQRFGLLMIPVIAFSYAVFGTIGVTIWVLIYNVVASVVGGVELTLEERGLAVERKMTPAPAVAKETAGEPGEGEGAHIPERPIDGF